MDLDAIYRAAMSRPRAADGRRTPGVVLIEPRGGRADSAWLYREAAELRVPLIRWREEEERPLPALAEVDRLLVVGVTPGLALGLASGNDRDRLVGFLLSSLGAGRPLAILAPPPPSGGGSEDAPWLLPEWRAYLFRLRRLGIRLLASRDELRAFLKGEGRRMILGEVAVRRVVEEGRREWELPPGGILTPLARDRLREFGIVLREGGAGNETGPGDRNGGGHPQR